jgi:glutamate-1-semialdehyde 2,1-aminomutase
MTAGLAALRILTHKEIARINALGDRLRHGMRQRSADSGVDVQANGVGSIIGIHFSEVPVTDYEEATRADTHSLTALHLSLLNAGIFIAPRGFSCISTAMTETEIDEFLASFQDAVIRLA